MIQYILKITYIAFAPLAWNFEIRRFDMQRHIHRHLIDTEKIVLMCYIYLL